MRVGMRVTFFIVFIMFFSLHFKLKGLHSLDDKHTHTFQQHSQTAIHLCPTIAWHYYDCAAATLT